MWLKDQIDKISEDLKIFTVYRDIHSVVFITKDQIFYKTKHIDVSYHFVREMIAHGDIEVSKVDTKQNPTNMMK